MRPARAGIVAVALLAVTVSAQDTVRVKAGQPAWGTNVGLKQLYVIGGPPNYDIGILYSSAVDRQNRVYIFDMKANQIKAFDADGKFVRNIGGRGSGPGEYRLVVGAAIVRDSLLATHDVSNGRLVVFRPDGSLDENIVLKRSLTNETGKLPADAPDHLYFKALFMPNPNGRGSVALPKAQQQWLRYSLAGDVTDSMMYPSFYERPKEWRPFDPYGDIWNWSGGGGVIFDGSDDYSILIKPFHGAVRKITRDIPPTPVQSDERAQQIAFYDAISQDPRGPHDPANIPKNKPAIRAISVDADGRIWVSLFAKAEKRSLPPLDRPSTIPRVEWRQAPVYDLYDADGKYLAHFEFPYGFERVFLARGDRVWLNSMGPDGEYLLTAFQITGIKR